MDAGLIRLDTNSRMATAVLWLGCAVALCCYLSDLPLYRHAAAKQSTGLLGLGTGADPDPG